MSLDSYSQSNSINSFNWDVIVVGAGAAGLMACLELPAYLNVLLLNRNQGRRSASRWAQGGMAAVVRPEDSLDSHVEDTLRAGAGLCDGDAVRMFVENAPKGVKRLQQLGMQFDSESGLISTTLEAAHSHRRVLHVKDRTGRALIDVLVEQVDQRRNVFHKRGVRVSQLLVQDQQCCGVQVLDGSSLSWISSRAVVLATGGGGHLFANTTNPSQASGEGVSLAWKAGAIVEDLEFFQFHPTALRIDGAPCFLLSEALRGEGAVLLDNFGNSPVSHLQGGDLASRDQISQALVEGMKKQKVDSFGLDLSPIAPEKLEFRFPTIINNCRELGIDPISQMIPVAPAAHYWMGGVATDLQAATSLSGLYAVGEVASTGLHGANRLASNSLMECIVFAGTISNIQLGQALPFSAVKDSSIKEKCDLRLTKNLTSNSLMIAISTLRQLCWDHAGVIRSPKAMRNSLSLISKQLSEISKQPLLEFINSQAFDQHQILSEDSRRDLNLLLDLQNRQITTSLLLNSCLFRKESRGGHLRTDIQSKLPFWKCHSRQQLGRNISTRKVRP